MNIINCNKNKKIKIIFKKVKLIFTINKMIFKIIKIIFKIINIIQRINKMIFKIMIKFRIITIYKIKNKFNRLKYKNNL